MKYAVIAAGLLVSRLALAQTNQPTPPDRQAPSDAHQGQQREQRFEEVKARHLELLSRRIAHLQQIQSCVQAASNPEALRACRPQHHPEQGGSSRPEARRESDL